jgi:hypothetical protein
MGPLNQQGWGICSQVSSGNRWHDYAEISARQRLGFNKNRSDRTSAGAVIYRRPKVLSHESIKTRYSPG